MIQMIYYKKLQQRVLSMKAIFFFFFKQKTAYEIRLSLVGSEMCIRDSIMSVMYLMDMKKYEEAETYTASVLSRLNCRPQEKQPEEDCSHEKEH